MGDINGEMDGKGTRVINGRDLGKRRGFVKLTKGRQKKRCKKGGEGGKEDAREGME